MTLLPLAVVLAAPVALAAPPPAAPGASSPGGAPAPEGSSADGQGDSRPGIEFKGELGGYYSRIFAVESYGGDVGFAFGRRANRRSPLSVYATLRVSHGVTRHGLSTWGGQLGPALEWPAGPLRFGGGIRLAVLSIERVTHADPMASLGFGAEAHVSVDLASFAERDALYLLGSFSADAYSDPIVWGPRIAVGYRFGSSSAE